MTEHWPPVVTQTEEPASPEPTPEETPEPAPESAAARKLEQAQNAFAEFLGQNRFSREQVESHIQSWLDDAKRVSAIELAPIFGGGGGLQFEHLRAATSWFVISSPEFAAWIQTQIPAGLLPQKKYDAKLTQLQAAVRKAEQAIVREKLEAEKAAAEAKLAELEGES